MNVIPLDWIHFARIETKTEYNLQLKYHLKNTSKNFICLLFTSGQFHHCLPMDYLRFQDFRHKIISVIRTLKVETITHHLSLTSYCIPVPHK